MELSLPCPLTTTPLPLVSFVGLEPAGGDGGGGGGEASSSSDLFGRFAVNRGLDRVPLHFQRGDDLQWPAMKAKRNSYEWFIPKGIIKKNWMSKHLYSLPAVVVIFMELDWNESNWNEKKIECASRVQTVRSTLSGRGTKLAVVLIQKDGSSLLPVTEDSAASERASSLCSACELSARALFVLPVNAENLNGYIVRLENAFYELAQNYYHQEIRAVKGHRDYLNKTTHLYLFVRHQFKAGFLNELKRDFHAAYKHYGQAYSLLMEVRATDTNIMEVKTVAGFISYKICKLAFRLNLPRDAISQFRKHMDIFQQKVGMDELAFEHKGWQSKQCEFFADVFAEAIKNGLPAIQTQHPGLYYQQAAQYAIGRRELSEELCEKVNEYPKVDPLENIDGLDFYGQRPWRPGMVALEPPDMETESLGIQALQFQEKTKVQHSKVIIELLQKAIEQFKAYKSPRSESHLTVTMAEELKSSQLYRESLDLLRPVMDHYRKENWRSLLDAVLSLGLKSAFLLADVAEYARLALDLCSPESGLPDEEKSRIMHNVLGMLADKKEKSWCPSAEPGLTSKSERAAVGVATRKWAELLGSPSPDPVPVDMSRLASAIAFKAVFSSKQARADEPIQLDVLVQNHCCLAFNLLELSVVTSNDSYKLSWSGQDVVHANKMLRKSFTFQPEQGDVGSAIQATKILSRIGTDSFSILLSADVPKAPCGEPDFFLAPPFRAANAADAVDGGKEDDFEDILGVPETRLEQRQPLIRMALSTQAPILVGEWFVIDICLENEETEGPAEDVEILASLVEADDPLIADTTRLVFSDGLEPGSEAEDPPPTPVTPVTPAGEERNFLPAVSHKVASVAAGSAYRARLLMRASTTGRRGVQVGAAYTVRVGGGAACRSELQDVLQLDTLEPFGADDDDAAASFLSVRLRKIEHAYTDETFLLVPRLRSLTQHAIEVIDTWVDIRAPLRLAEETPSQLAGCVLSKGSRSKECFPLLVRRTDLHSPLDVQELSVGRYAVRWRRSGCGSGFGSGSGSDALASTAYFDLSNVKVCLSSLYASAELPPFGVARRPMVLKYRLYNRTERVQEYVLTIEPSDDFMMSGSKQLHFKILPEADYDLSYVVYPLQAGRASRLPRLRLAATRLAQNQEANDILDRLLPKTIHVLPQERGDAARKEAKEEKDFYKVLDTVRLRNEPFLAAGKMKVVHSSVF